jgi:hypothetical protein
VQARAGRSRKHQSNTELPRQNDRFRDPWCHVEAKSRSELQKHNHKALRSGYRIWAPKHSAPNPGTSWTRSRS